MEEVSILEKGILGPDEILFEIWKKKKWRGEKSPFITAFLIQHCFLLVMNILPRTSRGKDEVMYIQPFLAVTLLKNSTYLDAVIWLIKFFQASRLPISDSWIPYSHQQASCHTYSKHKCSHANLCFLIKKAYSIVYYVPFLSYKSIISHKATTGGASAHYHPLSSLLVLFFITFFCFGIACYRIIF